MATSSSETKRLLANQKSVDESDAYKSDVVCIESLRAFGLSMTIVMLGVGLILTSTLVFPVHDGPEKKEDTYINKLFMFQHTCVAIDFNPSKTVAAVLLNFATIPLMLFTYLRQVSIKIAYNAGDDCLKNVNTFSQYTWKFRFCCFALFSMVFANSPDGEFIDPFNTSYKVLFASNGWHKYLLHYIPFFLWQLSLALMSIEQTWYHYVTCTMPFNISKRTLWIYNLVTVIVLVYYTVWILGFVFGIPIPGHTTRDETTGVVKNVRWGKFIMTLYLALTTLVPAFMSWSRVYGWFGTTQSKKYTITISPSEKKDEKDEEN